MRKGHSFKVIGDAVGAFEHMYCMWCLCTWVCAQLMVESMFYRRKQGFKMLNSAATVLIMLIMRHELMRTESRVIMRYCVLRCVRVCLCVCLSPRGSHLQSHACGSCIVRCRCD